MSMVKAPLQSKTVHLMENLIFNDIHRLNCGIQKIYALQSLPTFGLDAIRIIHGIVPSDVPLFHVTHVRTRQVEDTFLPEFPGLSVELILAKARYFSEHPIAENLSQALNSVCKISDFASRKELHSREGIYQSFLRPLETEDQMMLFLPNVQGDWEQLAKADATLVGFALNRSQRSFTERDRLMLNLLRPHLFQAYCNVQKHHQLQQKLHYLQHSVKDLGMIILNTDGRVQLTTPQALIWIEAYFPNPSGAWIFPDRLWSWVKDQVDSITNILDAMPACLPLRIQKEDRQLVIRLVLKPAENRYLLLLEEQTTSLLNSLDLLGLSQRETEVLAWVVQGKENKMIAIELGVGESTVRKHLERIYDKLGVSSRTEAIAHTLQKLGLL
jgi:DNA-binding CsgD family transcriptional regulator